jgi:hypothetical protein
MVLEVVCVVSCCSVFWKHMRVLVEIYGLGKMDPILPVGFLAHHALTSVWGTCLKRSNANYSEIGDF